MGITWGAHKVLPRVSAARTITAPVMAEAGKRNLWSLPISIRQICGATSPIKPMMPVKHITPEVIRDARIILIIFIRLTFTPRAFAASSPAERRLKSHDIFIINGNGTRIMAPDKQISFHPALDKLPKNQNTISCTCSIVPIY